MKKGLFAFLLFTYIFSAFSQTFVEGKVFTSKNQTLPGASVYLNNTTIGTTTNNKGEFQLRVEKGTYDLVVSFIGYTTLRTTINTNSEVDFLTIKLTQESNILDEVILKKTIYDDDWKYNLSRFKNLFLGRTKLAYQCEILNPKVLHFEYKSKTDELTADARAPLQIKHKGLGYLISYDLVTFSIKNQRLYFSGYARYTNLKKSVRKKWKRARQEAFNGSQMHFLRSVLKKNLTKDGFVVNQFRRELNPERPSDAEIRTARELISLHGKSFMVSLNNSEPLTKIDSARVTIRNSSKPKYKDFLYKRNVPYRQLVSLEKQIINLDFKDYLSIIYKNEKEEENYLRGIFGQKKRESGLQTSSIVLINGKVNIDPSGILEKPDALFVEGYWAFESFANMLPLDYVAEKN